ncbi:MAG: Holliday junction branch migration protein RuvA [Bacteroidetes bacterium]|nr:Holliday junction branch migration protein RuvA [Bacteroidota bacterium]
MIHYIQGKITYKSPTYLIVEAGGIGYKINISLNTYSSVQDKEELRILTYYYIKEDVHSLYGFASEEERTLFGLLLSVSGVGPSTTQTMLSTMNPEEIRAAIVGENASAIQKVKGIGAKTAQRIIIDLKDKILKGTDSIPDLAASGNNTIREEALSALLALGFSRAHVLRALNQVMKKHPEIRQVEEMIKLALRQLA